MGKALSVAGGVVKGASLLVGALTSFVCGMALVGTFVDNGWLRGGVSLLVMLVVPALITDRLLPKDDPTRGRGVPSDVFAVTWMAVPVLVALVLGGASRGPLLKEA